MIDDDAPVFPFFCCNLERSYDYSALYTVYNQNPKMYYLAHRADCVHCGEDIVCLTLLGSMSMNSL